MPRKKLVTVYSTDPEPISPEPASQPAVPANPAAPPPSRQAGHTVQVHCERKGRRGKTVSVISGILSHPAGKESLLKLLQKRLGAGGVVKSGTIEIQGDHRHKIVGILAELGYKARAVGS